MARSFTIPVSCDAALFYFIIILGVIYRGKSGSFAAEVDFNPNWTVAETDANLRALDDDLAELQAELDAALTLAAGQVAPASAVGKGEDGYEAQLRAEIEAELRKKARALYVNLPRCLSISPVPCIM